MFVIFAQAIVQNIKKNWGQNQLPHKSESFQKVKKITGGQHFCLVQYIAYDKNVLPFHIIHRNYYNMHSIEISKNY